MGLSIKEFADKLGYSAGNISEIENSKYDPSFRLLNKIIITFNINANWLFTGQGSIFMENKIKTEEERNLESRLQKLIKEKNSLEKKIMDLDKELQELDREFREICMRKDLNPKLSES